MQLGFKKGSKGSNMIEMLENGSIFTEILKENWRDQLLKYDIISFWGSRDTVSAMRPVYNNIC